MKLFTIGPVQMHPRTLAVRGREIPYFRNAEFSALTLQMDERLKRLLHAPADSRVVYLTASGSAAMEATVINLFTPEDRLLVINGGTFGRRFSKICDIHNIPHSDILLPFGMTLTEAMLRPYAGSDYTALLVNLDESSTGQLYDINLLHSFCRENGLLLIVDAITSFLCDPFDMEKFGIDAVIVSSQKGLALSPGLSMAALAPRAAERSLKIDPHSLYFDFKEYYVNMERGQMPYTPAIGLFMELNDMLGYILDCGEEAHLAKVANNAAYFRSRITELPCTLPAYPLSNAITPVLLDAPVAKELLSYLVLHGMTVNPCGGELASRMLRVAHVGDLCPSDYDALILTMQDFFKKQVNDREELK